MNPTALPVESPRRDRLEQLNAFHGELRSRLHTLAEFVVDLDGCHADDDRAARARALSAFFSGPVRRHNIREEENVIPRILADADGELARLAERLTEDHGWLELYWHDVKQQLDRLAAGDADVDLRALRASTKLFVDLYHDHVTVEDAMLYPQAKIRGAVEGT
jgi:hemerythrin-like domain-containing protein